MKHFYLALLIFLGIQVTAQDSKILRQPTVSSSEVVFVYANDLWKTSITGGNAERLTTNIGYESAPHFSADGKFIAFTAQYDGNTDVYVIPSTGGEPKRLTWHPGADFVQGWTPGGKVLFSSGRVGKPSQTFKFYEVAMDGGHPEVLAIPRAFAGEISPDGKHAAYLYTPAWDGEWRNYRGGQAIPIWIQDLTTNEYIKTPQATKERHLDPIWFGDKVFYLSERDYTSNIWSFDPKTKEEEQLTFHQKYDVKSMDAGPRGIVYEHGGSLHLLNPETKASTSLSISVQGDMNFSRPRWEDVTAQNVRNPNLSPTGKRVLFEHRGEIFSVPKEKGSWRNLTNTPGAAERYPIWSPKGDQIAWFSDSSGEYKLIIADQHGSTQKEITLPPKTFYFTPDWSPDGKKIAYTDTDYNIWITDIASGLSEKADTDRYAHPNRSMNPVWSPDSKWVAYSKQLDSHFKAIFAHNSQTKQTIQITDGLADAIDPIWDIGGKYLYFLASTDYGLQSGWLDMSSYDPDLTRSLYAVVLAKDGKAPNLPESDEEEEVTADSSKVEEVKDKKKKKKGKKDEAEEATPATEEVTVTIDATGIHDRIVALKLEARNYGFLGKSTENSVFVAEIIPNQPGVKMHKYDVEKQEAKDFASGVSEYIISADRASILLRQNGGFKLVGTAAPPTNGDGALAVNMKVKVDPQAEYHQLFREGWRYMRDFLYVDNTHGAPWDKVYEWYAPWIDHVRHRTDLNYVLDIMSGEIAVGHSFVAGGDMPDVPRVATGLLGCDLEPASNGFYKIAKIYTGERWNPDLEAPLALPGMDVKEGDYLISVNGHSIADQPSPYSLFEQTAGREITIQVNSSPSTTGARDILVKPIANESMLRRFDWMEGNRKRVSELSNGKLAYVYVPNTGGGGFEYFNRYYFAQQDKKGVIIDERHNGGGSAADYMIDIMAREVMGYFNSKANDNRPWTTPMAGIWGPKVMLINESAGSGGDLLPYMFHYKELGPLVGTRTWGGLVGTWDTPPFIDGGFFVAPRGGFFDNDGKWAVEGVGVAPDIEVFQDPKALLEGRDPQLERAVAEAMRLLEKEEFQLKPEPAPPVRWKRPTGFEIE